MVEDLDMAAGTAGMDCSCSSSNYKYELCGHVVTGDLSIIKDVKLRNLIKKGPTYVTVHTKTRHPPHFFDIVFFVSFCSPK